MADSGQTVDPAQMARMREIYGLDDPLWLQYWKWISGIVFRGDFGWSFEWAPPGLRADLGADGRDADDLARLAALRLVGLAADRHLLRGPPPLGRRPRLHLPRLPRPRHPELHHGADADVPLLQLLRAERRRPVLARVRRARPWSWAKFARPPRPPLDPDHRHRHQRHRRADPHPARQPDRRAQQALRRHRPRQGPAREPGASSSTRSASRSTPSSRRSAGCCPS